MVYYFGFLPSDRLNAEIDKAQALIQSGSSERYDGHRNIITHLINKELLDVMLKQMIASLPTDSDRKAQLEKIATTIEATTTKLVDTLLGSASNAEVMPSFEFLDAHTLFTDEQGQRRIGFLLKDDVAKDLQESFKQLQRNDPNFQIKKLCYAFNELAQASLQHFLIEFTQTLNLGMVKRTAIPVAKSGIAKGIDVAINKLLPQLPPEGLLRLADYYSPLILPVQTDK